MTLTLVAQVRVPLLDANLGTKYPFPGRLLLLFSPGAPSFALFATDGIPRLSPAWDFS